MDDIDHDGEYVGKCECGKLIWSKQNFCPHCGRKSHDIPICSNCGVMLLKSWKHCHVCGKKKDKGFTVGTGDLRMDAAQEGE